MTGIDLSSELGPIGGQGQAPANKAINVSDLLSAGSPEYAPEVSDAQLDALLAKIEDRSNSFQLARNSPDNMTTDQFFAIKELEAIRRHGVEPTVARQWVLANEYQRAIPLARVIPKPVLGGIIAGTQGAIEGTVGFFRKFVDGDANLHVENLRADLAHWDDPEYNKPYQGPEGEVSYGTTIQGTYGSKENLQRLIHASLVARAQGKELTKQDVAMLLIPPYAVASMVYEGGKGVITAPAELVHGEGNFNTRLTHFSEQLTGAGIALGMSWAGAREGVGRVSELYGIATRDPAAYAIANKVTGMISNTLRDPALIRDLANSVTTLDNWQATIDRAGGIRNVELQGIKDRLLSEEQVATISTLANINRKLKPGDVTIVPGIQRFGTQLHDLLERNGISDDNIAIHRRIDDGAYDVALFGNESPLADTDYLKQFEREGWFFGQEASYKGRPVAYESLIPNQLMANVRDINSGEMLKVELNELRRPMNTKSSWLKTEIVTGHQPRNPFDVLAETVAQGPFNAAKEISDAAPNYSAENIDERNISGSRRFSLIVDHVHDLMVDLTHANDVGHNLNEINTGLDVLIKALEGTQHGPLIKDTARLAELRPLGLKFAEAMNDLPVFNESQVDARRIATQIGHMNFANALDQLRAMKFKLGKTAEEVSKYVADVHKPAKIKIFNTDLEYDRNYEFKTGKSPYQKGTMVFGTFWPQLNEITMRPRATYEAALKEGKTAKTYEHYLSHEIAHAFTSRVIEFNRPYAEKILAAARRNDLSFVHPGTAKYVQWIDQQRASGNMIYDRPGQILEEAVTEELAHRFPVTPLKEMFQLYQTELRKQSLNDIYTDFKAYNKSIEDTPHLWESPISGQQSLPQLPHIENGPLGNSFRAAKRYFTKDEFMMAFLGDVANTKLNDLVTDQVMKEVEHYATVRENFSLLNNFDLRVRNFADLHGIPRNQIDGFVNFIGQRHAEELRQTYLEPEVRDNYNKVRDRLQVETGMEPSPLQIISSMDQLPLSTEAAQAGYQIRFELNGDLTISKHDVPGANELRFNTQDGAREFLKTVTQNDGPDLTKPTNIPQQTGGAAMPPSGAKPPNTLGPNDGLSELFDHTDKKAFDRGFFGHIVDISRASLDFLTGRETSFQSVDNLMGTRFWAISDRLRGSWDTYTSNVRNFTAKHLDDIGKMMKGLKKEQFANIFRFIESRSSDELMSEMLGKGRDEAVNIAKSIASSFRGVNLSQAIEIARKFEEIKKDMRGLPANEINQEIGKLAQARKLDARDLAVAGLFEGLRGRDINVVPIHEISRLADALMWDAPSQQDFAKLSGMGAKEILIGKRFENLFREASKIKGIPDYQLITGYIAHIRSQIGRDLPNPEAAVLYQKGLGGTMEGQFVSEFIRTGELSAIELNPYLVAHRYIDSAFKARDFVPAYREAMRDYNGELQKLSSSQVGKGIVRKMEERTKRYLSDLRGMPAPTNAMIRAGIQSLNDHLGTNLPPTILESLFRGISNITGGALLAFRPYIGLRHLAQFVTHAGVRFGMREMFEGLAMAEKPGAIEALRANGTLRELGFTQLVTPEEEATSMLVKHGGRAWDAYQAFRKVGHEVTLLPTIYEHTFAGVYLGMEKLALDNLTKLQLGKVNKLAAYDKLGLDTFAPAFRLEFDKLVSLGKIPEAASLIAKRAAKETIFDYHMSNAPRGWNSIQGKFLTMFGTWPLHATELVNSMLTRGSLRHRVNYAAKFAMAQGAIWLAGRSIGLDLLGSTIAHSYFWTGSPQVQFLQTAVTALNGQGIEQKLAQDRLFRVIPFLRTYTEAGERRFEFNFDPDTRDPRSVFIPGSYALGDWMQAIQASHDPWKRYTLAQEAGRAIGIPIIKHRSWVDDYLEKMGLHQYNYQTTVDDR